MVDWAGLASDLLDAALGQGGQKAKPKGSRSGGGSANVKGMIRTALGEIYTHMYTIIVDYNKNSLKFSDVQFKRMIFTIGDLPALLNDDGIYGVNTSKFVADVNELVGGIQLKDSKEKIRAEISSLIGRYNTLKDKLGGYGYKMKVLLALGK